MPRIPEPVTSVLSTGKCLMGDRLFLPVAEPKDARFHNELITIGGAAMKQPKNNALLAIGETKIGSADHIFVTEKIRRHPNRV